MNQTVEAGKTLLVDGPASVAVTSGSVEVFGSMLNKSGKIVIREGKRLPFAVHEKATFEISLGENANTEEVEGDTVPISWIESFEEISHFQNKPITVMVLGTVDSGKTSFCTYLANKLLPLKQKIAILDGDLGQSDIGPPCAVAYTFVTKPIADLFDLKAKNAFFIGVTSPSGAADKVIKGLAALRKEVVDANPDLLVINTDGWVQGEEAIKYKIQLVEELKPDIVFCIQQKDELEPIVNSLGQIRKVIVEFPQAVRQRSREKRRNLRELGYMKYLRNAKMQSYPLGWIKIEENEMLPASVDYGKMTYASKIFEILQMKPLHFSQLQNRIWMVIGKRRWISAHNIEKVEA
ncbi:MAG TPA: Clp1/GlmU family protein, partial [Candidatus Bathyarchaeia archaeon]